MPPMRRAAFAVALLALGVGGCGSSGNDQKYVVTWTIDPNLPDAGTTLFPPVDGLDAGSDGDAAADACSRTGCIGSCNDLSAENVSTIVNGCQVWRCCVPADAGVGDGADAGTE
jgi:hypothetical protein